MKIKEEITYPDIRKILDDRDLGDAEKLKHLTKLYDDERAAQRAASEAPPAAGEDETGSRLQHLKLAIDALDGTAPEPEDSKAATL